MVTEPLDNKIPEDIFDNSSSPQNEWDEWWTLTHKDTKATWEEPDDADELDIEKLEFDEE